MRSWALRTRCLTLILASLLLPVDAQVRDVEVLPAAEAGIDFERDVRPILAARCHTCHGPAQQLSGLRLDRREDALKGGSSGPVIVPGRSSESRLIQLVAGMEKTLIMPPAGDRLSDQEIGRLRAWIDEGAQWPEATVLAEEGNAPGQATGHWAFQALRRPEQPLVRYQAWVRNPIDTFVLARLESEGIEPSSEADKVTLLRRACLDLTGLPLSPAQSSEFLADEGSRAYERLLDRLLGSEHHGEKWARHWLDQARYADSDGYEKDNPRPHAWRYRHWVINALNRDLPFDQFTVEQLAGDLLPGSTVEQKVATGFHRNTLKNIEGGVDVDQYRFEEVVDRTATVGTVWLGLTVGCAQCHDHKYDPVSQRDFYRLFSFFNGADETNIDAPLAGEMGPYLRALPKFERSKQELLAEYGVSDLQPPWEVKLRQAGAAPGKLPLWDLSYDILRIYVDDGEDGQRILNIDPGDRTPRDAYLLSKFFVKNYKRVLTEEEFEKTRFKELSEKLDALEESFPGLSRAQTIERRQIPGKTHIHLRGQWNRPGLEVKSEIPQFLGTLGVSGDATRLDLARWLVSPENPLTARVTVNRIWQEYFGRGLVTTSDNFGTQGERPSHPKLLDWLGSELVRSGWSLKHIHRLITTSATYRQSSRVRPELLERDPRKQVVGSTVTSATTGRADS